MSRHCYTFQTSRGPVVMQFARAMTDAELTEAQPLAEHLATATPTITPEQGERQAAVRERNRERLDRLGLGFPAKYAGVCATCRGAIAVDERIQRVGDGYEHVDCPDPTALRSTETVCPTCFMVKPCECDDA